jgi:hypothetical protein
MTVRHREQGSQPEYIGSLKDTSTSPATYIYGSKHEGAMEYCDDIVGNRTGANPFEHRLVFEFYPSLTGKLEAWWSPGSILLEFADFPVNYQPSAPDPRAEFPGYTISELHDFAWKILAQTNPSVPHVSVPSFMGELKEFPQLLKAAGADFLLRSLKGANSREAWVRRTRALAEEAIATARKDGFSAIPRYLQGVASGHLSWRWGVKPMIGDLRKMLGFADAINNRIKELKNLRDGKTIRKRCSLGAYLKQSAREYKFLHSFYYSLNGWSQVTYTAKVWGSAEWKLAHVPGDPIYDVLFGPKLAPSSTDEQLELLARQVASGNTSHEALATAWELTPWSWLADWCGNVSDLIAASNNSVGCTWGRICVMRRSKGEYKVDIDHSAGTTPKWATLSGAWRVAMERKDRHPVFPVLPFPLPHLPLINSGRLSILGSLAMLKAPRF